jgi:hypothetical protein
MSKPAYRYEQSYQFLKKGIKHTIREQVVDGEKGLSIMFLKKKGDEFYKLYAKETDKDKFILKEKIGDKETETEATEKDLLKILKNEKLDGIINFISKERGTYKNKKISLKKNYGKAAEL